MLDDLRPLRRPEVPAGTVVGAVALVLGRAQSRLTWGAFDYAAITEALRDHPVGPRTEAACRALWSIMLEGDPQGRSPETIRETLGRLGHLEAVLRRLRAVARDDPDDARALEDALDWIPESGTAADMRLMIDAFHAYTSMFRDVCQSNIPVHELVDALVMMVTAD